VAEDIGGALGSFDDSVDSVAVGRSSGVDATHGTAGKPDVGDNIVIDISISIVGHGVIRDGVIVCRTEIVLSAGPCVDDHFDLRGQEVGEESRRAEDMSECSNETPLLDERLCVLAKFAAKVDDVPELLDLIGRERDAFREFLADEATENDASFVDFDIEFGAWLDSAGYRRARIACAGR
jgi:hypothetical protein